MNKFTRHLPLARKILNYISLGVFSLALVGMLILAPKYVHGLTGLLWIPFLVIAIGLLIGFTFHLVFINKRGQLLEKYHHLLPYPALLILVFFVFDAGKALPKFLYDHWPLETSLTLLLIIIALISLSLLVAINWWSLWQEQPTIVEEKKEEVVIKITAHESFKQQWQQFWNKFELGDWRYYVVFLIIIAIGYFATALFNNSWTVPLGGDYTQQTIPFYTNGYDDWWHFLKTGEFPLWDSSTNLGVNNIGSNAFYYAMNPFFLPILIFPRSLIPQGIAILMIGKLVLAAVAMKAYLTYMGVSKKNALFFAFAYAFCGWNTYYLWFNHFMEVTVLFPLVFLGIEKVLHEKKPWMLMGALALMGITNYFFLVTSAIVGVMYAGFRYFQLFKKLTMADRGLVLLIGFGAFLFGILMSAFVLLPGLMTSVESDRVTQATYLDKIIAAFKINNWRAFFSYVLRWETQSANYDYKKYYPLISFFFPTLSNRSATLLQTSNYDNTISSLFVYTPVMLLVIPSLMTSLKERKISHLLVVGFLIFAIFTPFFYNAFHVFTKEYGRWQLFVSFIIITYVALNYEKREQWKAYYYDASIVFILLGAYLTYKWAWDYQGQSSFGPLAERDYIVYYEFAAMVVVYLIYRFGRKDVNLVKYVTAFTALEVIIMGAATMMNHGLVSYDYHVGGGVKKVSAETSLISQINKHDDDFFRVYNSNAFKGNDNVGMRENYNGLGAFHSLYNFNLMEFNKWSRINYNYNGWSMGIHEKRYYLDAFLGVKYYMVDKEATTIKYVNDKQEVVYSFSAPANVPYGYEIEKDGEGKPLFKNDRYDIYTNTNFVELGSSHTGITPANYKDGVTKASNFYRGIATEVVRNEEMYLTSAILDIDDYEEVLAKHPGLTFKSLISQPTDANYFSTVNALRRTNYACTTRFPYDDLANLATNDACQLISGFPLIAYNSAFMLTRRDGMPMMSTPGQVILQMPMNYNVRTFLIGLDDSVITFDNHSGNLNSTYKQMRALYASKPVKSIVVVPLTTITAMPNTQVVYTMSDTKLQAIVDDYKTNGFSNITHSYNTYKFTTNYTTERFAVLNIPFDKGWSATVTKADGTKIQPKVYSAQGGFVGFVIPAGNVKVNVNYFTPYFGLGLAISGVGLLVFGGSFGVYYLVKRRGKRPEQEVEVAN